MERGRGGKLKQQFGPINRKGGERRINVLISRARERMIVVSSMKSGDLRIEEGTPKDVKTLDDAVANEEVKRWAVDTMVKFYDTLKPLLDNAVREIRG